MTSLRLSVRRIEPDPFDAENGTDTARIVRLEGLEIPSANAALGFRYQASAVDDLTVPLRSLDIDFERFVFIDIGSGKGRVVMLAAGWPFKRVIGVEFAPELHRIAEENVMRSTQSGQIELVCADASEYELPDEPMVLYFYTPFLPPVMRQVMGNVARSLERTPRDAFVILHGGEDLAAEIERVGFRYQAGLPVWYW